MKALAIAAMLIALSLPRLCQAQEREPLVMRILLEWTTGGIVGGAGVGVMLWLVDPGRPSNNLAEQMALGAAWGSIVGLVAGVNKLNTTYIPPVTQLRPGALHPSRRIHGDPVADDLLAVRRSRYEPKGLMLPPLRLRF